MKKLKIQLLFIPLVWLFSMQTAQANFFLWEVNFGTGDFQPENGTTQDISVMTISFGGFLTQLVTYELQYGFGWDDNSGLSATPDVSHAAALAGINVGSRDAYLSFMGGAGAYDIATSLNDTSGSGLAVAVSANLFANERSGLTFEILNITDDDEGEYGQFSMGFKRKF